MVLGTLAESDNKQALKSETTIQQDWLGDQQYKTIVTDENEDVVRTIEIDFDRKFFGPDSGTLTVTDANGVLIASGDITRRRIAFSPDEIEIHFKDSIGREIALAESKMWHPFWDDPTSESSVEMLDDREPLHEMERGLPTRP